MAEELKPPYLKKDVDIGDLQVWIVDGIHIQGHMDEEFTNLGQRYRYPYIPKNELRIDQEAGHDAV